MSDTRKPANPFRQASYRLAAHHLRQLPGDTGWEVAIAGRSNAGKSSAINVLTGQRALARTSKTPGRTQQIVIFDLDDERRIADLPGYGYAKVPQALKEHWQTVMQGYFETRESLRGVVLVMEKSDKLKRGPAQAALLKLRRELPDGASAQVFSAKTRAGLNDWLRVMNDWYEWPGPPGTPEAGD